jgi:transcriptional regulator
MYTAPVDATLGEAEWRPFVEANSFGHLVAAGRHRDVAVVVPTQFLLEGDTIRVHLVRTNPLFAALAENPHVLLSVAGDWAFIPSSWKAIGDEDPRLGIPTTYYGVVQFESPMDVKGQFGVDGDAARHDMKGPLENTRTDSY